MLDTQDMLEELDDANIKNLFSLFRNDATELTHCLTEHTKDNQDNHSAIIVQITEITSAPHPQETAVDLNVSRQKQNLIMMLKKHFIMILHRLGAYLQSL